MSISKFFTIVKILCVVKRNHWTLSQAQKTIKCPVLSSGNLSYRTFVYDKFITPQDIIRYTNNAYKHYPLKQLYDKNKLETTGKLA